MKRFLTITVLLLIVALTLTACGGKDEDKETVYDILADAFEKTANAGKSESASIWEQALSDGSIEANLTYEKDIIPIKSLSSKLYFGENTSASTISIALFSGETFDFSAFSDTEKAIFLSSVFTGAYGFTNQGLAEFLTQMLAPQEDTETSASTALGTSLTKVLEKNEDKLTDILKNCFPLIMKEAESSLNFSFMVSNTNVKQFLGDILTILENDAEFKQALQDYMVASGESMTSAEISNEFKKAKEELNALDETPFDAAVAITASKDRIIQSASVTVYEGGKTESGTLATKKQLARVLISLPAGGGFNIEATIEGQSFTVGYTVTEFGTVTKEVLSIGAMGVTLTPLTLTYDSANGDYEMKLELPGTFSATAKGKYTATKTEATLTVSSIKATITPSYEDLTPEEILGGAADAVTIDLPVKLTFTAKATDTVPKAPASYKDISTLSEKELEALGEKFLSDPVVQTYIEMIESLLAGSNVEDFPIAE